MKNKGETEKLLGSLDTGPTYCTFTRLVAQYNKTESAVSGEAKSRTLLAFFLGPIVQDLKYRAEEFHSLVQEYTNIAKTKQLVEQQVRICSVAKWIFCTNKLEYAGMDSEEDTLALIQGQLYNHGTTKEREVLACFKLLKETYDTQSLFAADFAKYSFDSQKILHWHEILFADIFQKEIVKQVRKCGVETKNLDGTRHYFPHHSIISRTMQQLLHITHALRVAISSVYTEWPNRVLYCFALASFVQYHFVDIHPFSDGNGRMCRFLSKYILDWVCPIPFPMFQQREAYFASLINGRKEESPNDAPKELLNLLFSSAIDHYKEMLSKHLKMSYDIMVAGDSWEEVEKQIVGITNSYNSLQLVKIKFDAMNEDEVTDVCLPKLITVRIKKVAFISFDDL